MPEQVVIEKILAAASNAPSGSNSQPWRFEVSGDRIRVLAEPEKDHPILNYRYRGTWIAHGALIENIKIAAAALGWRAAIEIFPDVGQPNLTAEIKLSPVAPVEEELFQVLPERATNRQRYDLKLLTAEQKKYLEQSVGEVGGEVRVVWVEDRNQINRLAQAAAANEIVTLENQELHRLFFDEVVWTRQEEAAKKQGLFVATMELKPPEKLGLKLFRRWPVMRQLAKLGAARKVAASNSKNYAATPLMGLVAVKDNDSDFITAGRVIERIWLKAARFGFGFHLITGTMFFWQGINLGGLKIFSEAHRRLVNDEYGAVAEIAGLKNKDWLVTAMFRVGPASAPSARSIKRPPVIALNNQF
ncbi:MAG: nitroreductase family protein [Candidatus Vogelbacteria bacterium]|nr:nitroreductase family protein [Candidatus Vogelbacteria bacterium]